MRVLITYRDVFGEVTEREISDLMLSPYGKSVDAFCHLRNDRRTFALDRVHSVVNIETGEVLSNLAQLIECPSGHFIPPSGDLVTAVKALKYFCLQVRRKRGFAMKERQKILLFIERNDKDGELTGPLDEWLQGLWAGNIFDPEDHTYQQNLNHIPAEMRAECRAAAIYIASGSGRVPRSEEDMVRINWEYPLDRTGTQLPGRTISRAAPGKVVTFGTSGLFSGTMNNDGSD